MRRYPKFFQIATQIDGEGKEKHGNVPLSRDISGIQSGLEISHELRVFHSPVFSTGESEKSYTFEISRLGSRRWQIFRTQSRQFNVSIETGSRGPVLGGERRFLDKSIRS